MSALHYTNEAESSRFHSANRPGPPPPSTPYLTKKLLTMVTSSERHGVDHNSGQRRPQQSSPISPTDSIAEAMRHDLEELVGYIDNLAFDPSDETASGTMLSGTHSTNKQLFLGEDHPSDDASLSDRTGGRKNVFRDRTNRFGVGTGSTNGQNKLGSDPEAVVTPRKGQSLSSIRSVRERAATLEEQAVMDPLGTPPMRQEPTGSLPPQEASMYFHDESLSLILSQSEDTDDEGSVGKAHLDFKPTNHGESTEGSERAPRLWSALQQKGFMSTPARAKTISFRTVSKDPTPSKPARPGSTTQHSEDNGAVDSSHRDDDLPSLGGGEAVPSNDRQRTDSRDRLGTPYPRRALDRFEQRNLDRKGKEWWRARPVPVDDSAPTTSGALLDFESNNYYLFPPHDDDNKRKTLQWETGVATPLPRRKDAVRGTPHPSGRGHILGSTDDANDLAEDSDPQRVVPETPVMGTGGKRSNLVLTSPESAKKLLTEAVTALNEARRERDAAREWASSIKESVHKWVEDQRELIRSESALSGNIGSVPAEVVQQQHQAIEKLINKLRNEIRTSKSDSEANLQTMLVKQDEHIRALSRQLSDVKEQLSCVVRGTESNSSSNSNSNSNSGKARNPARKPGNKPSHVDAPGSIHKTPPAQPAGLTRTASRSDRSNASSRGSHRTRRATANGGHWIDYGNGVTKEIHPDGTSVTRFRNGDVETRFGPRASAASSPSASAVMAYYHSQEEVLKITLGDGSVLYEYATGQVERHCANGVKIIRFPDGTKTIV